MLRKETMGLIWNPTLLQIQLALSVALLLITLAYSSYDILRPDEEDLVDEIFPNANEIRQKKFADPEDEGSGECLMGSENCILTTGIKRGSNPIRVYDNGCPSDRDNEDILADVLQFLSTEFGVETLGRAKSFAANSCQEVVAVQNMPGLYWIKNGTSIQQKHCNF